MLHTYGMLSVWGAHFLPSFHPYRDALIPILMSM